MAPAKKHGLDINEDRAFQEKFWTFERWAWIAMALVVLLALAGLTGQGGPLSTATVSGAQGSVTYPSVARWQADSDLTVTLPPATRPEASVELGRSFADLFEITDIQPTPSESEATAAGQRLLFKLGEPHGERQITLRVRGHKPAVGQPIEVRIDGGDVLTFTPTVLP
jgi:hypothetical protein